MDLINDTQLANTQRKLAMLKSLFDSTQKDPMLTPYVREVSVRSLRRLMNQLEEEIIRYQIRRSPAASAS